MSATLKYIAVFVPAIARSHKDTFLRNDAEAIVIRQAESLARQLPYSAFTTAQIINAASEHYVRVAEMIEGVCGKLLCTRESEGKLREQGDDFGDALDFIEGEAIPRCDRELLILVLPLTVAEWMPVAANDQLTRVEGVRPGSAYLIRLDKPELETL